MDTQKSRANLTIAPEGEMSLVYCSIFDGGTPDHYNILDALSFVSDSCPQNDRFI